MGKTGEILVAVHSRYGGWRDVIVVVVWGCECSYLDTYHVISYSTWIDEGGTCIWSIGAIWNG